MTKEEEEEEEDWARRWREPQLSDVRLLSEGCRQEGPNTETNNEKIEVEKITAQFERPSAYVQRFYLHVKMEKVAADERPVTRTRSEWHQRFTRLRFLISSSPRATAVITHLSSCRSGQKKNTDY